ncbi:sugar lactone lactonase YvrE [Hasllibacter halocynthiae]|uniref:Sugar lactone lactonase YvrE n=1 Tax=Hasllibacter halocynthiae TaxID=595589 RepID=A0A2T0X6N5_9RHOB|nr:SMP-30/gluconolactonase/LRE family protein [Hasllibacter halocynthiae]PRY94587.1 sugar lactone lactonase YvrE [Hasllibacter halocynthiae]
MMDVFDPRPCQLGEGPLWHPGRGQLFWFDILGGRLMSRAGGEALEWDLGEMASAAGWVDRDTLLLATETALRRFDIRTGALETVLPLEEGDAVTRSNDGRADPMGGFWIGTMGKEAEEGVGTIYRLHRGDLRALHEGVTIPNAICFAPDGRTGYHADTARGLLWRQPLDPEGWPEGGPEVLIDFRGEGLNPDGAVTDAHGNLWIAQWGASRIACHAPDGVFLRAVALEAPQPSCPAFGGADLSSLHATTARQGMDAAALDRAPLSGRTFVLKGCAQGRPEPRVVLG